MQLLSAFVTGLIFGAGLILAGMANPAKVLAFLDIAGAWDPSLALVMAGAILVGVGGFFIARKRTTALLGGAMHLPTARELDRRLIGGSLAFGVGWGLAGFCPGPALVAIGMGYLQAVVFVVAMLAGIGVYELLQRRAGRA